MVTMAWLRGVVREAEEREKGLRERHPIVLMIRKDGKPFWPFVV